MPSTAVNGVMIMNNNRLMRIVLFLGLLGAIICRTDKKSAKVALLLTEEGFADVHIVRGGMTKWIEAGLPVLR